MRTIEEIKEKILRIKSEPFELSRYDRIASLNVELIAAQDAEIARLKNENAEKDVWIGSYQDKIESLEIDNRGLGYALKKDGEYIDTQDPEIVWAYVYPRVKKARADLEEALAKKDNGKPEIPEAIPYKPEPVTEPKPEQPIQTINTESVFQQDPGDQERRLSRLETLILHLCDELGVRSA